MLHFCFQTLDYDASIFIEGLFSFYVLNDIMDKLSITNCYFFYQKMTKHAMNRKYRGKSINISSHVPFCLPLNVVAKCVE